MKKNKMLILIVALILFLTGCDSHKEKNTVISNGEKVNTSKMQVMHCSREGSASDGIEVELKYDLYYTGENINILHSEEKVISSNDENLDLYENAYKKIHTNYEELKYYDAKVIRGDTTVTSDITINYEKIDIQKLLEIEGEEHNIIENGKAKVDAWLTLAKKFGTTCDDPDEA